MTCVFSEFIFRAQKHLVSLEGAQKPKLDKWQSDINDITSQQNEIQGDLKAFETPALDVDRAKKQSSDLKVVFNVYNTIQLVSFNAVFYH